MPEHGENSKRIIQENLATNSYPNTHTIVKQFLHNHGLFAALLTASFVGHVSMKWIGPVLPMAPQMLRSSRVIIRSASSW